MAAGAWTTCFEWSHLSLELDPHEELPVSFSASLIVPNYSPPSDSGGAHPQRSSYGGTGIECSEADREIPKVVKN